MQRSQTLLLSASLLLALASCGDDTVSFGEYLNLNRDNYSAASDDWHDGKEMIAEGQEQIEEGNALIRKGYDAINQGNQKIANGTSMVQQVERQFQNTAPAAGGTPPAQPAPMPYANAPGYAPAPYAAPMR